MEENQEQLSVLEPTENVENSNEVQNLEEGQVNDVTPSEELILGKFKSVEELTKAYEKLERHQGLQSEELGNLRKQKAMINHIQDIWNNQKKLYESKDELVNVTQKYNTPEYFQDSAFRDIYKEAYLTLGKDLDTEKFINLLENYVASRLYAVEKSNAEKAETENMINKMSFSPNTVSSITPPKKSLDEMTSKEVDDILERLI